MLFNIATFAQSYESLPRISQKELDSKGLLMIFQQIAKIHDFRNNRPSFDRKDFVTQLDYVFPFLMIGVEIMTFWI